MNIRAATPSIFKLFSFPAVEGKNEDFLKSPNTIILAKSLSERIFGNIEPIGQKITVGDKDYEVTGIIEDLPLNTDLQFSALSSSELKGTESLTDWGDYFVYLQISNCNIKELEKKN